MPTFEKPSHDSTAPSRTDTLVPGEISDVEKGENPAASASGSEDSTALQPVHVIPEGGWKAWSTVAGAWLIMMSTFGYIQSFGVFQALYVEDRLSNYSASTIAWIGGAQVFLIFAMGIPAGRLFDAHHFRATMITGSVLLVGCCFALSAAQPGQYYQYFLSQGLGQGIACGLMYLPGVAVLSQHFAKKRALAIGVAFTGGALGRTNGFEWGVRAAGFFLLGNLTLGNLLMHSNYNPAHKTMAKPSIMTLLKDRVYVTAMASGLGTGWGLFFPFFFLQLYASSHGMSQTIVFYTIAITNAGAVLGRIVPNLLADRFGPITCQIPPQFISAALIFALFGVKDQGSLIAFAVLYGIFSGAVLSLYAPMLVTMADSMAEVGIRMGVAFCVMGIAGLTGNPINGALLGSGPEYAWWKAIVFSGISLVTGACLMTLTRRFLQEKRQKRWV
ncbi:MFS general substrate transporter [Calocera viscosa TUFC12733]|uniref:MFS general substrate transporter n=1 Tax=Calocera viscosa (strain TUFC12733) TaxID=1330018 RepID=A0A167REY0_CALVF|nr:MFS general substrate transporter [Calocera viscosa TUFC12733]